jgi:hypothetical protein
VRSGGSLRITADPGTPVTISEGAVEYYDVEALWDKLLGQESKKYSLEEVTITKTSEVGLGTGGNFTAGVHGDVKLVIPANFATGTITGQPATLLGQPISATYDAGFDPHAYISDSFGAAGDTLKPGVPAVKGAVKVAPIVTRSGGVTVRANTFTGASRLEARNADILVSNNSPRHLVLDNLRILNVAAGNVDVFQ